jgi:apolipoprotein N-acyltransferase
MKTTKRFAEYFVFKIVMAFLSAILLILIFPPFDVYFLAWVALVPLLLVIRNSGLLRAFLISLATGLLFYGFFIRWLFGTEGVNYLNYALSVLFISGFYGVFGMSAWYFQKRIPRWNIVTLPSVWVILEYIRSHMSFLSSPWGMLGYSQYTMLPVAQIASFTGVYGVSFFIVLINTVLAEFVLAYVFRSEEIGFRVRKAKLVYKISIGVLAGILILFVFFQSSYTQDNHSRELKVALVQGNIYWNNKYLTEKYRDDSDYREKIFEKYSHLTRQVANFKPELILWPSSSVPGKIPYDKMRVDMLSDLAKETGSFLLVGSSGFDKFNPEQRQTMRLSNSAFLFSTLGEMLGRYDKIRLLPFDEYLPLRRYIKWPSWIASDMIDSLPGKEKTIFNMGTARFGVLICWENIFPEQFREMASKGVQFMVSMTNEGFTRNPTGHYQMLAVNVFRAVENHVAIARTASTGVSCIIEPNGRIVDRVMDGRGHDVDVEGYLVGQIPLTSERSFYNRYGDWFIYVITVVVIGIIVWNAILRKYFLK